MIKTPKLETINASVVDKLPSSRTSFFGKDKVDREASSMTTDKAKKSEDEISYVLDEKSTIDEGEETGYSDRPTSPDDRDVMSLSANSSANFSFATHDTKADAYPALYNPEVQAVYEQKKIEEEERRQQEKLWAPVMEVAESVNNIMHKIFAYLQTLCVYDVKGN